MLNHLYSALFPYTYGKRIYIYIYIYIYIIIFFEKTTFSCSFLISSVFTLTIKRSSIVLILSFISHFFPISLSLSLSLNIYIYIYIYNWCNCLHLSQWSVQFIEPYSNVRSNIKNDWMQIRRNHMEEEWVSLLRGGNGGIESVEGS